MNYKVKIERFVDNPNYDSEYGLWYEKNRYNSLQTTPPDKKIVQRVLEVDLTEEEFNRVKNSVITVFN